MSKEALAEREQTDVDYRVQVAYMVPVEVIVDLQKNRVERVVVITEEPTVDYKKGARQEDILHPIPSRVARLAIEIAEGGDWPVWEHGF